MSKALIIDYEKCIGCMTCGVDYKEAVCVKLCPQQGLETIYNSL